MRKKSSGSVLGSLRKWWHQRLGHHVLLTMVRDMRTGAIVKYEFYFRSGWICIDCHVAWPR